MTSPENTQSPSSESTTPAPRSAEAIEAAISSYTPKSLDEGQWQRLGDDVRDLMRKTQPTSRATAKSGMSHLCGLIDHVTQSTPDAELPQILTDRHIEAFLHASVATDSPGKYGEGRLWLGRLQKVCHDLPRASYRRRGPVPLSESAVFDVRQLQRLIDGLADATDGVRAAVAHRLAAGLLAGLVGQDATAVTVHRVDGQWVFRRSGTPIAVEIATVWDERLRESVLGEWLLATRVSWPEARRWLWQNDLALVAKPIRLAWLVDQLNRGESLAATGARTRLSREELEKARPHLPTMKKAARDTLLRG